jgi:hypothetical protein
MMVTCALRKLDGFDTIDLFEQALHSVCASVHVQVCARVRSTNCVFVILREHMRGVSACPIVHYSEPVSSCS